MNRVAEILMQRDAISYDEAISMVIDTREEIYNSMEDEEDFREPEEIIMDNLGLEGDYLLDIL